MRKKKPVSLQAYYAQKWLIFPQQPHCWDRLCYISDSQTPPQWVYFPTTIQFGKSHYTKLNQTEKQNQAKNAWNFSDLFTKSTVSFSTASSTSGFSSAISVSFLSSQLYKSIHSKIRRAHLKNHQERKKERKQKLGKRLKKLITFRGN